MNFHVTDRDYDVTHADNYSLYGITDVTTTNGNDSNSSLYKDADKFATDACLNTDVFNPHLQLCDRYFAQRCAINFDDKCDAFMNTLSDKGKTDFVDRVISYAYCKPLDEQRCSKICRPIDPLADHSVEVCDFAGVDCNNVCLANNVSSDDQKSKLADKCKQYGSLCSKIVATDNGSGNGSGSGKFAATRVVNPITNRNAVFSATDPTNTTTTTNTDNTTNGTNGFLNSTPIWIYAVVAALIVLLIYTLYACRESKKK